MQFDNDSFTDSSGTKMKVGEIIVQTMRVNIL